MSNGELLACPQDLELAVALYVADECESLEEARVNLDRVRSFMVEAQTAEHDGDCTKQCHTCLRCLTETYIRMARIVAELDPRRTQLDELRAALVEARKWLCPPGPPVNPSHPIGQTILMIDKAIGGTNGTD